MNPDLDHWLAEPAVRVTHRREAAVAPADLWEAARAVRIADTRMLGRLVRWRIPGTPAAIAYDELFRTPPFTVLDESETLLISGLVGRIWTLRCDYPPLADPEAFRRWRGAGTARVLFATWVEPAGPGRSLLATEARVVAVDRQARLALRLVRPLISRFHHLIGSEGIALAARRAEAVAASEVAEQS